MWTADGGHEPRVLLSYPLGRVRLMIGRVRSVHVWAVIEVVVDVAGNGAVCDRRMLAV